MTSTHWDTIHGRRGFSLLEVLLALGLSVVIFAAIASAIRIHLISIGQQQVRIEQRQLARNLLDMMANDFRAAVQYRATDFTGLENLVATQATSSTVAEPAGGETDTEVDDPEPTSATTEDDESPIVDEDAVSFRPTLLGDSRSISVDVSRLPRMDQYGMTTLTGQAASTSPSDIKSVGYFFSGVAPQTDAVDFADRPSSGGLYRREVDRAVASFAGESGLRYEPDRYSRLMAPEISGVQFRYFDGSGWNDAWDSGEDSGFPLAVEITVFLDPGRVANVTDASQAEANIAMWRHVVHLPTAEIIEDDAPGDLQ